MVYRCSTQVFDSWQPLRCLPNVVLIFELREFYGDMLPNLEVCPYVDGKLQQDELLGDQSRSS